jgi:hypothetical protein
MSKFFDQAMIDEAEHKAEREREAAERKLTKMREQYEAEAERLRGDLSNVLSPEVISRAVGAEAAAPDYDDVIITVDEMAKIAGVHPATLRRYWTQGEMDPPMYLGPNRRGEWKKKFMKWLASRPRDRGRSAAAHRSAHGVP